MGMVGRIPSGAHENLAAKKRADLFTDEVFLAHAGRFLIRKMPVRRGGGALTGASCRMVTWRPSIRSAVGNGSV